MTTIAVVLASTRTGRVGEGVARWVLERASARDDASFEFVDLAEVNLPQIDEPLPPALGRYTHPWTQAWAQTVAKYDGYLFVTPEYNRGAPGVLKTPSTASTPSGTTKLPPSSPTAMTAGYAPSTTPAGRRRAPDRRRDDCGGAAPADRLRRLPRLHPGLLSRSRAGPNPGPAGGVDGSTCLATTRARARHLMTAATA